MGSKNPLSFGESVLVVGVGILGALAITKYNNKREQGRLLDAMERPLIISLIMDSAKFKKMCGNDEAKKNLLCKIFEEGSLDRLKKVAREEFDV